MAWPLLVAALLALAGRAAAGNFTLQPSYIYSAAWAVDPLDANLFHVVAQAATTTGARLPPPHAHTRRPHAHSPPAAGRLRALSTAHALSATH